MTAHSGRSRTSNYLKEPKTHIPSSTMSDTAAYSIATHVAVPQKAPYGVDVEEGKTYYWCTCGLSKNQPFCDGSHQTYNAEHKTTLKPMAFTAKKTEKAYLCGCKQTKNPPFCDGSHTKL
ncbi:glutamate synthase domain protein [Trypanosoma conorhini]|uniref:Glutamate synthase domain protein n=1 Tax=Trypanosoma conorhini TaxID=83891 RepID=A0A3R7M2F0_9TRYP|nr:glutamate synthase domain protein [Trypanosoma conorhini]RNF25324.1 glutamate synthase domain protein [Trypanosoma conorhini]